MYLHYTSSHPKHCKTGLPYSQFLRLRRICSHDSDFTEHAKSMSQNFINRGYPPDLIHSSLTRAQNHDRQTLFSPKTIASQSQTKQAFFAISTFHPSFTAYKRTIQTNWDTLSRSLSTRCMFDTPITFGYRRPKNLREHLVHAKLPSIDAHDNRPKICPPKPCTKRNCRYCQTIDKSSSITDPTSQRKYIYRYNVTCQSQNLIYAIQCTKCQKLYVGQTKRRCQTRPVGGGGGGGVRPNVDARHARWGGGGGQTKRRCQTRPVGGGGVRPNVDARHARWGGGGGGGQTKRRCQTRPVGGGGGGVRPNVDARHACQNTSDLSHKKTTKKVSVITSPPQTNTQVFPTSKPSFWNFAHQPPQIKIAPKGNGWKRNSSTDYIVISPLVSIPKTNVRLSVEISCAFFFTLLFSTDSQVLNLPSWPKKPWDVLYFFRTDQKSLCMSKN